MLEQTGFSWPGPLVSLHFLALRQTRPSLLPPRLPVSHVVTTLHYPAFPEDARLFSSSLLAVSSTPSVRQIPTHSSKLWPYAQPPACPGHTLYKSILVAFLSPLDRVFLRVRLSQGSVLSIKPRSKHLPGAQEGFAKRTHQRTALTLAPVLLVRIQWAHVLGCAAHDQGL